MDIYKRLEELGLQLPPLSPPVGLFERVRRDGDLLYVAGQGSYLNDERIEGKVGGNITIADAARGASYCVLNALAALENYLGDLNKIGSVIKVLGFVASEDAFHDQPKVINGASGLLVELFGEQGKHARSALGTNVLPGNLSVEIEFLFKLK